MKKKRLFLLLLLMGVVVLFVACKGNSGKKALDAAKKIHVVDEVIRGADRFFSDD